MINFLKRFFIKSDEQIAKAYYKAASTIGDVVSYSYMGEPIGMENMVKRWAKSEKEYAKRGYRTISLDMWIKHGGYGKSINHLWMVKRERGEKPIYHSKIYERKYLDKITPSLNLSKLMKDGEPQVGRYQNPSTEAKKDNEE